jgi:hypothetical protein
MTITPIALLASFVHLHQGSQVRAGQRTLDLGRDTWQLRAFHGQTGAHVHAGH